VAYAVFASQVVAVDTVALAVTSRLEFIDRLHMAFCATLVPSAHVLLVAGSRPGRGWGLLTISLPDLRVRGLREIRSSPARFMEAQSQGVRGRSSTGLVLATRMPNRGPAQRRERLEYLDGASLASRGSAILTLGTAECPGEELHSWRISRDGRRLVLFTGDGFKYQSYLRVYALPSMEHVGDVPLLELRDDAPVDLFVE
jgi:hypothetical protein